MRKPINIVLGLSLGLAVGLSPLAIAPGFAKPYSEWKDPNAPAATPVPVAQSKKLGELLKRLKAKLREAEKARAADPRFLKDLRSLVREFETPWAKRLVFDNFHDGDFTKNPKWIVTQGRFWVERGQGLRSVAEAAAASPATRQDDEPKKLSREEKAAMILGALLGGGSNGDSDQATAEPEPEPVVKDGIIHTRRTITNAFALNLRLSSWTKGEQFEIGVYQEKNQNAGYRIGYTPGQRLELLRISRRGTSVIDTSKGAITLENKKAHSLGLQRFTNGRIRVLVDGKKLIDVVDKSYKDPFSGVIMVNRGGDYTFHQLLVDGTQ